MSDRYSPPSTEETLQPPAWSALHLVAWIFLMVGLGLASGLLFQPDDWFDALLKPTFQPPPALFGPVWTALYACMGIAVWRMQRQPDVDPTQRWRAFALFWAQLALNMLWSPLFFGAHSALLAFIDICLLWLTLLATLRVFGRIDPLAGYLLLPYLLWVTFALVLNGTIWLMNA